MAWALVVVESQEVPDTPLANGINERIAALFTGFSQSGERVYRVGNALDSYRPPQDDGRAQCLLRYGADAFAGSGLARHLRNAGISSVVLCGNCTDGTVMATARRTLAHGFDLIMASDAHLAADRDLIRAEQIIEHYNQIMADWISPGRVIEVLPSDELLAILRDEPALPLAMAH
ncbi:cysteine hydrolase family protein [Chitinimonas naiadis]